MEITAKTDIVRTLSLGPLSFADTAAQVSRCLSLDLLSQLMLVIYCIYYVLNIRTQIKSLSVVKLCPISFSVT